MASGPLSFDTDFLVIGSGFGGGVSALRLTEKGYRVTVLEQGRRFGDSDFARSNWDLRRYLWMPLLKCFGIQRMSLFKNVLILSGVGVGGGSLVYANTLLEPGDEFFNADSWRSLADWKAELAPHYQTARRMLGVARNPRLTFADRTLQACALELGRDETFTSTDVGVYFGEQGREVPDPYFAGSGPSRTGCTFCGACMVGCRVGAKNTLVKNYLYLAEKAGVRILPERRATRIEPLATEGPPGSAGYAVTTECSTAWFARDRQVLRARHVVLSAGVIGTMQLLLDAKHRARTLPALSDRLGFQVRTNSESLVGVTELNPPPEHDYAHGVAISSSFYPTANTHIEVVRYPRGSGFMRLLAAPMADGSHWLGRPLRMLGAIVAHPWRTLRLFTVWDWARRTTILLVMQTTDNRMRFTLARNLFTLFRKRLSTAPESAEAFRIPSFIPIGNQVARAFAQKTNGIPQSAVNEVALNIPTTAHILGGCAIGRDAQSGVIDAEQRVFGYQGLFVCDGSAIPANLGVNPSLTITAMTERAMSKIPPKDAAS